MSIKLVCIFPPPGSLKFGEATVNGRVYRWEFHEWMGPTFLRADWETFLKRQPGENHPVWPHFYEWLKKIKEGEK